MDRAHNRLGRLHRKLGADYAGPDDIPPLKPKWMRWRTYPWLALQLRAGEYHRMMSSRSGRNAYSHG